MSSPPSLCQPHTLSWFGITTYIIIFCTLLCEHATVRNLNHMENRERNDCRHGPMLAWLNALGERCEFRDFSSRTGNGSQEQNSIYNHLTR